MDHCEHELDRRAYGRVLCWKCNRTGTLVDGMVQWDATPNADHGESEPAQRCLVPGCRNDAEDGEDYCRGCREHFGALAED